MAMTKTTTPFSRRKPLRLSGYDYSGEGAYFVTICTKGKKCLFGAVQHDQMMLNEAGTIIAKLWSQLPDRFDCVALDSFVLMPNHIHGIVLLDGGTSLSRVLQEFKSLSSNEYIRGVRAYGWPSFDQMLWQRSFYDHVIRDDRDMARVRDYISNNPLQWAMDEENPGT